VTKKAQCPVKYYGCGKKNDYIINNVSYNGLNTSFHLKGPRAVELDLTIPKPGLYNALNAAAGVAAFLEAGGAQDCAAKSLISLKGVKRRQEVLFDKMGLTLIDDFAHHPTAVACTLEALKGAFGDRRLICAFEPRSNTTRRSVFQDSYAESLAKADFVYISAVDKPEKAPQGDRLNVKKLAGDIGKACAADSVNSLQASLLKNLLPGDVVVTMSNGGFNGLTNSLISKFEQKVNSGGWWYPYKAMLPKLKYTFNDKRLLLAALTHPSVRWPSSSQEDDGAEDNNQRLEFLGDAILDLCVAELLFELRPHLSEGAMTKIRSMMVCEPTLAQLAKDLGIGESLIMTVSEEANGGRKKASVLADALEASLGAVFLDGGFEEVKIIVRKQFTPVIEQLLNINNDISLITFDYKTKLQEFTQSLKLGKPFYSLVSEKGPDHAITFTMAAELTAKPFGRLFFSASGPTKRAAEQKAAKDLFERLSELYPERK
jgi:ribonuclease III